MSGYKIELVCKRPDVERWSGALDDQAIAIAAFEIVPGGDWRIEAYTIDEPDDAAVRAALSAAAEAARVGMPAYHVQPLPPTDWLAQNRHDFPAQAIGRFFVYGSHHTGGAPAGRPTPRASAPTPSGPGADAPHPAWLAAPPPP